MSEPVQRWRRRPGRERESARSTLIRTALAFFASALTTVTLVAPMRGAGWLLLCFGALLIIALVGAAARAARVPRPLVIVLQAVGALLYGTALYAPETARWGFLPGPDALSVLSDRIDAALTQLDAVLPPFAPSPDIALLTIACVALTGIAVDALAVTYRKAPLGGIPLLVLYAVPALTMSGGLRGLYFLLPGLGFLLLLACQGRDRLLRWTRAVAGLGVASGARSPGYLQQASGRIGLTVLSASIVVPAVIPTVSGGLFDERGIGDDSSPITTLDPLVEMRRNLVRPADVDLMSVRSDTTKPGEQYLRTVTLDEFSGDQWRAGPREVRKFETALPSAPGLSPAILSTPVSSTLDALPNFTSDYLPLPYPTTRLGLEGKWRLDPLTSNILSIDGQEQITGTRYTATSLDLDPTRKDVSNAEPTDPYLQQYLRLPELPPRVVDTAQRVTAGAQNALQIGSKLQKWFRDPANFTYDLKTPQGSGKSAILNFLDAKRGYCEQFASTMAVMARKLGVPARVNVGFTDGDTGGDAQTRTISAHDAHAWPELFLPGVGWTRFEPTPGSASSQPSVPGWLQDPDPKPEQEERGKGKKDKDKQEQQEDSNDGSEDSGGAGGDDSGSAPLDCTATPDARGCEKVEIPPLPDVDSGAGPGFWGTMVLLGLAVLLLLASPALLRAEIRRRRWASITAGRSLAWANSPAAMGMIAEVAWRELRDSAVDLDYAWPVSRTPRQAEDRVTDDGALSTRGKQSLLAVTRAVEQTRYAAGGRTATNRDRMRGAVDNVRQELGVIAGRRNRIRAVLLPRSLQETLAAGVERLAERAGGIRTRVTRRLRPGRATA